MNQTIYSVKVFCLGDTEWSKSMNIPAESEKEAIEIFKQRKNISNSDLPIFSWKILPNKKNKKVFQKPLDKQPKVCYNKDTKEEKKRGTQQ